MKPASPGSLYEFDNAELQRLFDVLLELYEQRQSMVRNKRADRKENLLRGLEELYALYVHGRRTLDELVDDELERSGPAPYRQLTNRIHQRHTRVRRDLLRWIDAQTRRGRGHITPIPKATADIWTAAVCTLLCERQSRHRIGFAGGGAGMRRRSTGATEHLSAGPSVEL